MAPDGEILNLSLNTGSISVTKQPWYVGNNVDPVIFEKYVRANYSLKISDYWKCLSMLKQMESANLFADKHNVLVDFGSIDQFQADTQDLLKFVLAKAMNMQAQSNVAAYLGTTADNIVMRNDPTTGSTVFRKVK